MKRLEWSALEYEPKERSQDWFWALGVIVIASSLAAIIFGNYFFAALIILAGILLWIFAVKEPEVITYELSERGVKIKNRLYPYENIKSFWVETRAGRTEEGEEIRPLFFIKSERFYMPIISIPIDGYMAEDIHLAMLGKNIPEEEMSEHASQKIMESLGF